MSVPPPGWNQDPNLPAGTIRQGAGSLSPEPAHHLSPEPVHPLSTEPVHHLSTEPVHHLSPEPQFAVAGADSAQTAPGFAAYDAPAAATGFNEFASAPGGQGTLVQRNSPTYRTGTLTQRNPTTFTAIFVVALYLVLAKTTGIVLVGIFPAMLAFRAFQRREPLAGLAVAAAAVAIVFSMTVLTRH